MSEVEELRAEVERLREAVRSERAALRAENEALRAEWRAAINLADTLLIAFDDVAASARQHAGVLRDVSATMRRRRDGITLDEVRATLRRETGPT